MRTPPKSFRPDPFPYHHELELEIHGLTNLGVGVARVDQWVVFVPFTIPGERVKARIFANRKNYSEADLLEVLRPSPHRVTPECPLFGECGGCQYQHFAYEAQLDWKRQQIQDLIRLHLHEEFEVTEVAPSPRTYGYRSKITPHYEAPRQGQIGPIGFLKQGSRRIIDVPECRIALPVLNEALKKSREHLQQNPPTGKKAKKGATLLFRAERGGQAGVVTDHRAHCIEEVGPLIFRFTAGDFFQNNPAILPQFVQYAINQAKGFGAKNMIDAYCGSGLFGISAASHFNKIIGIEVSELAVEHANFNAAANGITNAHFIHGSAEAIFQQVDVSGEETVVVIDPPRKGCDEIFLNQLFAYSPAGVVYISCDPSTQLRDLAIFRENGYTIEKIQPFDLFPQTRHLECIATLKKVKTM